MHKGGGGPRRPRSPRKAALDLFCRWQVRSGPLAPFIEDGRRHLASSADERLFLALVNGVLRQQDALDLIISELSSQPIRKMRPRTLWTLRIGLLQILVLERIPHQAAVNETVRALKESRQPGWLTGFVNALLRRAAQEKTFWRTRLAAGNIDAPLFSHPAWLVERWQERFGAKKTAALCRADNLPPALTLCCNRRQISPEQLLQLLLENDVEARLSPLCPGAIGVHGWQKNVETLPGFEQGLFWVQDGSSQMVARLFAGLPEDGRFLDCCAGVGGKTAGLLLQAPEGIVQAVEPDRRRGERLQENVHRLQMAGQVERFSGTLERFVSEGGGSEKYDGVLVDAPCSGLGVIRRHPDIRWNRSESDFPSLADTQLALLDRAATAVRRNGVLVYSVCSMEPEETVAVVEQFLQSHTGFRLEPIKPFLPAAALELLETERTGCFLSLPAAEMDGFFAARFLKKQ